MISASEALRWPQAALSGEDEAALKMLEEKIDTALRENFRRGAIALTIPKEILNPTRLNEICRRYQCADWDVMIEEVSGPSAIAIPGNKQGHVLAGFRLAFVPSLAAYRALYGDDAVNEGTTNSQHRTPSKIVPL